MTIVRLAALATLAAAAVLSPPAAAAAPPSGPTCRFLTTTAAQDDGETFSGVIYGGPLAAPGAASVTLRCSIHVGNLAHTGPAAASETSEPRADATVLEPRPLTYVAAPYEVVGICSEATVDGTTWYESAGAWSTAPAGECAASLTTRPPGPIEPPPGLPPEVAPLVWWLLCYTDWEHGWFCTVPLDETLCPRLAQLYPGVPGVVEVRADGDVYVAGEFFWDCPPYEPFA